MKLVICSPSRMLGDSLVACLADQRDIEVYDAVSDLAALPEAIFACDPDLILLDACQEVDFEFIRELSAQHSRLGFVALGHAGAHSQVLESEERSIRAFVPREATPGELCRSLRAAYESSLQPGSMPSMDTRIAVVPSMAGSGETQEPLTREPARRNWWFLRWLWPRALRHEMAQPTQLGIVESPERPYSTGPEQRELPG